MKINIGSVTKVSKGLHIMPSERDISNLEKHNVSKAFLINYDDILDYTYDDLKNTLNIKKDKKTEVYINLEKRYKNSRIKNFDIIINSRSIYERPKLICFNEENIDKNYIYDNTAIFMRAISPEINMKFMFEIMQTQKVRQKINEESEKKTPRRILCSIIQEIVIDLPSIEEQEKIVKEMEYNRKKLDDIIKIKK